MVSDCGQGRRTRRHGWRPGNRPGARALHAYLGPVLDRCGHEESEHGAGIEFGDVIDDMCHSCYGGAWHAFEEES